MELNLPLNIATPDRRAIRSPNINPRSQGGSDPLKYEVLTFRPSRFRHPRLATKAQLRPQTPPPPPKSRLSIHQSCNKETPRETPSRTLLLLLSSPPIWVFHQLLESHSSFHCFLLSFSSPQDSRPHSSTIAKDLIIWSHLFISR